MDKTTRAVILVMTCALLVAGYALHANMTSEITTLRVQLAELERVQQQRETDVEARINNATGQLHSQLNSLAVVQNELVQQVDNQSADLASLSSRVVDVPAIIKKVLPSVVQVERRSSDGTAFFVDGYFMTNDHVVGGHQGISITDISGTTHPARLVRSDAERDIALIQSNGYYPPSLPFSTEYETGERVYVIGNPGGLGLAVTEGVISNAHATDAGREYIQISAEINHGNSGGPVINERGEVIGVVRKRLFSYDGISYAIPAKDAKIILTS